MVIQSVKYSPNIDRLRIATPCQISWDEMTGDSRVRFCDHCQLNVYNISELSRIEAEKLIASTEGRLCARMFRRADGTILTKDCPVGLRALRLRVAKRAALTLAAIVSLSAAVFGQQSSGKHGKTACTTQTRITQTPATSDPAARVLSGTVVDPMGAAIPGAKITVINAVTKGMSKTSTNDEGRFEYASLSGGNYSIKIELTGFKSLEIKSINIEKDKFTHVDLTLQLSGEVETVGILISEPDLIYTMPGTTIMSGDIIRRLPTQK